MLAGIEIEIESSSSTWPVINGLLAALVLLGSVMHIRNNIRNRKRVRLEYLEIITKERLNVVVNELLPVNAPIVLQNESTLYLDFTEIFPSLMLYVMTDIPNVFYKREEQLFVILKAFNAINF